MKNYDFVNIATSKDAARFGLCHVYRDKKELVASDGHRLHYTDGLPEIDQGYYLDNIDAQFPDWRNCILKDNGNNLSLKNELGDIDIFISSQQYKDLVTRAKLISEKGKAVVLTIADKDLVITGRENEFVYKLPFEMTTLPSNWTIALNLQYLLDAIKPVTSNGKLASIVGITAGPMAFDAVLIKTATSSTSKYFAVLMPANLKG